jgi:hypothetical protein
MSIESAVLSSEFATGREQVQYYFTQTASAVTNSPVRSKMMEALGQIDMGIDFSTLYLRTRVESRLPFALRPLNLTEDEARELDGFRERPSPIEGRRLRGIRKY